MPVIGVVGNKGGAGKTTLTVNLATGLTDQYNVAIVDTDPQGSSLQWYDISDQTSEVDVLPPSEYFRQQVAELSDQYDYVFIDCPPSVHAAQTDEALSLCDIALIPVQPSPIDLWATVHIEKAIDDAQEDNPKLKALMIINQLEPRTKLSRSVRDVLSEIELPVAKTSLRRRAVYRNSAIEGKSIFHMGKRGADATEELKQLIEEIKLL